MSLQCRVSMTSKLRIFESKSQHYTDAGNAAIKVSMTSKLRIFESKSQHTAYNIYHHIQYLWPLSYEFLKANHNFHFFDISFFIPQFVPNFNRVQQWARRDPLRSAPVTCGWSHFSVSGFLARIAYPRSWAGHFLFLPRHCVSQTRGKQV